MPLSDLLQRAQAARRELIESQLETRFWDVFDVSTQWNRMQKLRPYWQEPLLNGFVFKFRMGCIFLSPVIEAVQRLSAPAARIWGVSLVIFAWKSPKETSKDGLSPFYFACLLVTTPRRSDPCSKQHLQWMAEPTNDQVMRQSLILLSAVSTIFNTHLSASARAVRLWTPFCITTSGVTQPARLRFQASRTGKAHVPYYLVDPAMDASENDCVQLPFSLAFSRGHEVRRRTCWMPRSNLHGFPPAMSGKTGLTAWQLLKGTVKGCRSSTTIWVFYNELGKATYHKALRHLRVNSAGPSLLEKDSIKIANNTKSTKKSTRVVSSVFWRSWASSSRPGTCIWGLLKVPPWTNGSTKHEPKETQDVLPRLRLWEGVNLKRCCSECPHKLHGSIW